jgi:hypothetical protein
MSQYLIAQVGKPTNVEVRTNREVVELEADQHLWAPRRGLENGLESLATTCRRPVRVHGRRAAHARHRSGWDGPSRVTRCRSRQVCLGRLPVAMFAAGRASAVQRPLRGFHVSCAGASASCRGWRRVFRSVSGPLSPGDIGGKSWQRRGCGICPHGTGAPNSCRAGGA